MSGGKDGRAPARRASLADLGFAPRFAYGDQAQVAVVCGPDDGTALGTGFARMTGAAIPWTIRYDEVLLVIEGALSVETPDGTYDLGPTDTLWLPAGTELTYRAESALVFYAIHPSDWADANA